MSECRCFRLVDARYAGEKGSVIQAREGCPIHCRRNPPRMPPVPSGTFVRKREVFQGVLGPEIARTTVNNADEFIRRWAART